MRVISRTPALSMAGEIVEIYSKLSSRNVPLFDLPSVTIDRSNIDTRSLVCPEDLCRPFEGAFVPSKGRIR